ncbi:MAG: IclR family transcriptional regulator [Propionibacteriaceae bacterium]|jgi:IclR family acetate operon transcriptional repressor|nr:IclR family transcriptional regulator [Propionibacteriaceae bacterium]
MGKPTTEGAGEFAAALNQEPKRRHRVSTTSKVLMLLRELSFHPEGLGVREAARKVGLDKSAVSRMLSQLAEFRMAVQEPHTGRYLIGQSFYAMAATVHRNDSLSFAAEPMLRELSRRYNETCYLTVYEEDAQEVVYADRCESNHVVRCVQEFGHRAPLHASAAGRAVLSAMAPDEIRSKLGGRKLDRYTAVTLTDVEGIVARAGEDQTRGYVISEGDYFREGTAIAAPFFFAGRVCGGALLCVIPQQRCDEVDAAQIGQTVAVAAGYLTLRLGGIPKVTPA